MMKTLVVLAIWAAVAAVGPLRAGAEPETHAGSAQDRRERIGGEAVVLTPPLLPAGVGVANVFADWGVGFSSEDPTLPVSGVLRTGNPWPGPHPPVTFLTPPPAPFHAPAILNGPADEAAGALTIRFDSPARWVYLVLGSETTTTATVRAGDTAGAIWGELTGEIRGETWEGSGAPWVPFLIEDPAGGAVGRIEVEYSDPAVAEAVLLIAAEFVDPHSFVRCVPRVAHGALAEGRTLQTLLSLTSPAAGHRFELDRAFVAEPEPKVDFILEFFDEGGAPMPMEVGGVVVTRVVRHPLPPGRSRIFRTTGAVSESGLDAGYACVTSNYPLESAAVYRVLDPSGAPVSEAGIEGVRPGHRFVGLLHKETAGETNTALALANVSDGEATAAVTFLLAPATTFRAEVALPARGHGAWFVDEEQLFPELFGRDVEGTLEIVAEAPIVATILRTIRGVVSASLPLARQRTGLGD